MNEKVIKSYKAFNKDMTCKGFQYEVGKEYEMCGEIECCRRGFHACKNPLEVFDYYDMFESRFAEVEQSGIIDKGVDSTKICSSRIKIKAELELEDIINIGMEWLKHTASSFRIDEILSDHTNRTKRMRSTGDNANIGSLCNGSIISSSGRYTRISSSGDCTLIGSSGFASKISLSGDKSCVVSTGVCADISSVGCNAKICSSGNNADISSLGDWVVISSTGVSARIYSSGIGAKINSMGDNSVIICSGSDSAVKAKVGSLITLTEWKWSRTETYVTPCIKTEYVDGENIKADTWYQLKNGKFVEVNE